MNIEEAPLLLPVLLDVGSAAGSTQLFLAAVWSTSGPRGSKGMAVLEGQVDMCPEGEASGKNCS